ncbi:hypothetical protein KKF47_03225 [Patescibacteria group bacterium]|nr:hypothetical protein [Patescibacteria group bacterium]
MKKKIFVSLFVLALLVIVGGGFYWWQNQQDVREINKTLPEGIKVVKGWFNKEYKVVNNIDGYEFKVPKVWEGINNAEYIPSTPDEKYSITSINLRGLVGGSTLLAVDYVKTEKNPEVDEWARKIFEEYGFSGEFLSDQIGDKKITKTQENEHLAGMYVYFFKSESSIYIITNGSEEFIQEIILNGKW